MSMYARMDFLVYIPIEYSKFIYKSLFIDFVRIS